MTPWRNIMMKGAIVALSMVTLAGPSLAQRPPGPPGGPPPGQGQGQDQQVRKKRHNSGIAAGIAAGVLGGVAGAALLNGQAGGPPPPPDYGYAPPPPPPPGPRYDYVEDDEPVCRVVRKPVYDEDGEVVSYRTRRVCR